MLFWTSGPRQAHGCEYVGAATQRCVVTPATERCFLALARCFASARGGFALDCNLAYTCEQLAVAIGERFFAVDCACVGDQRSSLSRQHTTTLCGYSSSELDSSSGSLVGSSSRSACALAGLLKCAALLPGTWACVQNVDALSRFGLSTLAAACDELLGQARLAPREAVLSRAFPRLVLTTRRALADHTLPDFLRHAFRPQHAPEPDLARCAELWLVSRGCPGAEPLAKRSAALWRLLAQLGGTTQQHEKTAVALGAQRGLLTALRDVLARDPVRSLLLASRRLRDDELETAHCSQAAASITKGSSSSSSSSAPSAATARQSASQAAHTTAQAHAAVTELDETFREAAFATEFVGALRRYLDRHFPALLDPRAVDQLVLDCFPTPSPAANAANAAASSSSSSSSSSSKAPPGDKASEHFKDSVPVHVPDHPVETGVQEREMVAKALAQFAPHRWGSGCAPSLRLLECAAQLCSMVGDGPRETAAAVAEATETATETKDPIFQGGTKNLHRGGEAFDDAGEEVSSRVALLVGEQGCGKTAVAVAAAAIARFRSFPKWCSDEDCRPLISVLAVGALPVADVWGSHEDGAWRDGAVSCAICAAAFPDHASQQQQQQGKLASSSSSSVDSATWESHQNEGAMFAQRAGARWVLLDCSASSCELALAPLFHECAHGCSREKRPSCVVLGSGERLSLEQSKCRLVVECSTVQQLAPSSLQQMGLVSVKNVLDWRELGNSWCANFGEHLFALDYSQDQDQEQDETKSKRRTHSHDCKARALEAVRRKLSFLLHNLFASRLGVAGRSLVYPNP